MATPEQQWEELCKQSEDARRELTVAWRPILVWRELLAQGVDKTRASAEDEARFSRAIAAVAMADGRIEEFKRRHFHLLT